MKNIIIGTAGHVDHGKTALIKALTGIETDRIKEEKKRGITIELGFAYLDLPDGEKAGIIDVPGHEKFVKNMLAGAGGIDLALLVVAADEGFMPQTREHLGILSLLNISEGIIVVTKKDMVDEDWLEIVCDEVRQEVQGTFLENAQIIPVSSYTGEGIEQLRQAIFTMIDQKTQIKNLDVPFRIPVDRIFSVEGFGTVITGTLIEGTMKVGDPVTVYPSRIESRIRNLQVHSQDVQEAYAGQRVAVNLAGLKKTDLNKGDVIAVPDSMHTTMMIDIHLTVLKDCDREIRNATRLHLYHGARDILCKIVLLDRDSVGAGESCYAQLRLEEEIAVKTGDGRIFVEAIDCRPQRAGNAWILDFLEKADVDSVVVDGASGQELLASDMKRRKLKAPKLPTVKEIIMSNSVFSQAVAMKTLCHMGQPSVVQIVSNCEKRAIGSNGGYGFKSILDGAKVELMDSLILAHWLCGSKKERKKQKISY